MFSWIHVSVQITEVIIHNNPVFEESRYMTLIWWKNIFQKLVKQFC